MSENNQENEVESINGKKAVIKREDIDNDNRLGCLVYGVIPANA